MMATRVSSVSTELCMKTVLDGQMSSSVIDQENRVRFIFMTERDQAISLSSELDSSI